MTSCGWGKKVPVLSHGMELVRSKVIELFMDLRRRGIRAHIWPWWHWYRRCWVLMREEQDYWYDTNMMMMMMNEWIIFNNYNIVLQYSTSTVNLTKPFKMSDKFQLLLIVVNDIHIIDKESQLNRYNSIKNIQHFIFRFNT